MLVRFLMEETGEQQYDPITHVYAFPKEIFDNMSVEPSAEELEKMHQDNITRRESSRFITYWGFSNLLSFLPLGMAVSESFSRFSEGRTLTPLEFAGYYGAALGLFGIGQFSRYMSSRKLSRIEA